MLHLQSSKIIFTKLKIILPARLSAVFSANQRWWSTINKIVISSDLFAALISAYWRWLMLISLICLNGAHQPDRRSSALIGAHQNDWRSSAWSALISLIGAHELDGRSSAWLVLISLIGAHQPDWCLSAWSALISLISAYQPDRRSSAWLALINRSY